MTQNDIEIVKEQEAQQAQTIANEIESAKIAGNNKRVIDLLEEIVNSQAQKIAEQAKEIERLKDLVRKISGAEPDPFNIVAGVRRSHNKQQTVKR